jgi:YidC/Oxa1 family membrane protein insertase
VTPVILTVFMFFQQRLTPTSATMDPMQQKMMMYMPLVFGFFMISMPAGLAIYMLISTVAGVGQQLVLNKRLGGNSAGPIVLPAE